MVVVYRMAPLSYQLARRVVTLDTIGMVNVIAGETIAPEFVQDAFTAEAVAREAVSMLTDRDRASRIRARLAIVRERLGGPGASRRAAEAILRLVHDRGAASTQRTPEVPLR
jgi:lipid-A-disaccharide synthase